MTDLVLVAVLVIMAVLLGAASLAIVLLYRGWKSNRALITDLNAQIAAQQIAALTGENPPAPGGDADPPEPVRRRRHLALYIGGGVAAFWATCRDSVVNTFRAHPAVATSAVAAVATVSTAAALVLTSQDVNRYDTSAPPQTTAGRPDTGPAPDPDPADDTSNVEPETVAEESELLGTRPALTLVPSPRESTDTLEPTPGSSSSPAARDGGKGHPGGSGPSAVPPAPVQDAPEAVQPPADTTPPGTPPPDAGDQEEPNQGGGGKDESGGLCVKVPVLLDLCLLNNS